jgi:DnaK suppressor protein
MTPARKKPRKPSSKKTVKSAKSTSQKKVAKRKVPAQKGSPKTTGQKKSKLLPKKAPVLRAVTNSGAAHLGAKARAANHKRRSSGNLLSGPIRGFSPYQPKRGEDYMSKAQLAHFRQILLAWKRELMEEVDRTMLHMKDDAANFPDPNDRATQESEFGLELRTRDRERKLLKKIDSALSRIDDGSYGYCEETGDEIGLRRLEARPVATLCVEAQERRELAERQFRDREDHYR